MSYARILGGTAAVSGGLYAYYRFRDSGQQVCKLHKYILIKLAQLYTILYINFVLAKLIESQKCLLCCTSFFKRF